MYQVATQYTSVTRTKTDVIISPLLSTGEATSIICPGLEPKLKKGGEKLGRVHQRINEDDLNT